MGRRLAAIPTPAAKLTTRFCRKDDPRDPYSRLSQPTGSIPRISTTNSSSIDLGRRTLDPPARQRGAGTKPAPAGSRHGLHITKSFRGCIDQSVYCTTTYYRE